MSIADKIMEVAKQRDSFDAFEVAEIICDLLDKKMIAKYGYEPRFEIDVIDESKAFPSKKGCWVCVFQYWNNVRVYVVEIHHSGEAYYNNTSYDLLDLKERTNLLSTIEGIST
jgi:hypothetical protein